MDELRKTLQVLDGSVRQNAVAEVENVPRPTAGALNDPASAVLDHGPGPQQQRGIQVSLDGAVVTDYPPGIPKVDPPIEADHVAAGFAHQRKDPRRAGGEVDRRRSGALQRGDDPGHVRPDKAATVHRETATDPT